MDNSKKILGYIPTFTPSQKDNKESFTYGIHPIYNPKYNPNNGTSSEY